MNRLILVFLIAFQTACTSQCRKEESSAKQMVLNIKDAETDNLPFSDEFKSLIDKQADKLTSTEPKEEKNTSAMVSSDCKSWVKPEGLNAGQPYFQKVEGQLPIFNDESQTLMFVASPRVIFHKVYDDAIVMLFDDGQFKFREIKPNVLEKGLMGILQSQSIIAGESSQWNFSTEKEKPFGFLIGTSNAWRNNEFLKKFHVLTCSPTECLLSGGRGEPLKLSPDLPEALALKKLDIFDQGRINALKVACNRVTSEPVISDYNSVLKTYENACDETLKAEIDFEKIKSKCNVLTSQIIPLMQTFQ